MNLSCWCKHFFGVYFLISTLLLTSFALTTGDEPTEEPEESNSTKTKTNETIGDSREDSEHIKPRSLFDSSGETWKTARKMLHKGIQMFRDSLQEGVKVAHMFKEDLDEGVSSIMRQNRGVKIEGQPQNSDTGSGSIFDSQMLREGVLGGILRFMGVNSKQMGVIALNVLIILAEWITSSMIGNSETVGATSRMIKSNLLEWASTGYNSQMEKLIMQAKSHSLPEKLIDKLSEKTGNSTSCVQLLICKMSPVIWGVQDTVKDQINNESDQHRLKRATSSQENNTTSESAEYYDDEEEDRLEPRGILATSQLVLDKLMGHMPPTNRILDFGDRCEKKFPQCQLLSFGTGHKL